MVRLLIACFEQGAYGSARGNYGYRAAAGRKFVPVIESSATSAAPVPGSRATVGPLSAKPAGARAIIPAWRATVPAKAAAVTAKAATVPGKAAAVPGKPATVPGKAATVPGKAAAVPGKPATVPGKPATVPGKPAAAPGKPATSAGSSAPRICLANTLLPRIYTDKDCPAPPNPIPSFVCPPQGASDSCLPRRP
jgi:hypothetical protein